MTAACDVNDARLEAVVEQYRRDSELRKPRPGMLLQAARELDSLSLEAFRWADAAIARLGENPRPQPDPLDNVGFVFFSDPDGNGWALQELVAQ